MEARSWVKKNWINIALGGFIGVMLFYPPAKVWVLQRIMATGVFNASPNDGTTSIAAPMVFKNADGEIVSTENLKGKIVFINFWASWCPPCLAEMPSIQNLYNHYRNEPRIVFIMADADNKVNESIDFLRKRSIELPVYSMYSSIDPSLYKGTLPTTVILDKQGRVILNHSGIGRYDTDKIFELLEQQLKN